MSDLERVTKLAKQLVKQKADIAKLEERLDEAKKDMGKIEREDLPDLMAEIGVESVKLDSGETIMIASECNASISKANQSKAFAWLAKHGYAGIIKTCVSVSFGKGDHDKAEAARAALSESYEGVTLDESVHPSTLKSFVKERLEHADKIPLDLFGVFQFKKAIVK